MSAGTVFGCVLLITKKYVLEIDLLRDVTLCVPYYKTTKMQSLNVKQFFFNKYLNIIRYFSTITILNLNSFKRMFLRPEMSKLFARFIYVVVFVTEAKFLHPLWYDVLSFSHYHGPLSIQ